MDKYGYTITEHGEMMFRFFNLRREAIDWLEEYYGYTWRTLKKRGFEIAKVKLELFDWEW